MSILSLLRLIRGTCSNVLHYKNVFLNFNQMFYFYGVHTCIYLSPLSKHWIVLNFSLLDILFLLQHHSVLAIMLNCVISMVLGPCSKTGQMEGSYSSNTMER